MGVHYKENGERINIWMFVILFILIAILIASLIVYFININFDSDVINEEKLIGKMDPIVENEDEYETVSMEIGKKVEEEVNENSNNVKENILNETVDSEKNTKETSKNLTIENKSEITKKDVNKNSVENEVATKEIKEIKFIAPLKGQIIKEFAPDSLVYSDTLEEWITHNGIDVKADKTSVVTAAADGEIYAIKTDPRYGLTVIVNHENGYQTVYANLLTAEYVVEKEQIKAGQTIGTVGNSANFEIADEYHLHFEITQNGDYVNPQSLMDF